MSDTNTRRACGGSPVNDVVPGCGFTASAETEKELMEQVVAHAKHEHGVTEVTPELAAKVKAAITPAVEIDWHDRPRGGIERRGARGASRGRGRYRLRNAGRALPAPCVSARLPADERNRCAGRAAGYVSPGLSPPANVPRRLAVQHVALPHRHQCRPDAPPRPGRRPAESLDDSCRGSTRTGRHVPTPAGVADHVARRRTAGSARRWRRRHRPPSNGCRICIGRRSCSAIWRNSRQPTWPRCSAWSPRRCVNASIARA